MTMPRYLWIAWIALCWVAAGPAAAQQSITGGTTRIALDPGIAGPLGIRVTGAPGRGGFVAFSVEPSSSLPLVGAANDVEGFGVGELRHETTRRLVVADRTIPLQGFRLVAGAQGLDLHLEDANGTHWFTLRSMHAHLRNDRLEARNTDLLVAPALAQQIGRPDLERAYVGFVEAEWTLSGLSASGAGAAAAGGGPCDPAAGPIDVALIGVDSVSQGAREAGVRVAVSAAAMLKNVGTGSVDWFRAIAPGSPLGQHPYLVLHFYRLVNGELEQIGRSDLKHAFFSVNTECSCPGDNILYATCEDTYAAITNLDRFNLAPRDEVTAWTASWTSLGSHFDATPVDDTRDHSGNGDHDDFEHRLVVPEPDLSTSGARYFIEAWYIVEDDTDLLNSLGRREVDPVLGGSVWSFATIDGGLTTGSILDELVDPGSPGAGEASELVDTGEGRVQLVVTTSDLGGGQTHYEYALMNFDFDRQIESFEVPKGTSVTITNTEYRDGDSDGSNDWTATIGASDVTWTAPPGAELDWGMQIGFSFDADLEPGPVATTLDALEAGATPDVSVSSLGPAPFEMPSAHPVSLIALALALAVAGSLRRRRPQRLA